MVLLLSSLPAILLLPSSVYLSLANLSEEEKEEQIDTLFLAKGDTEVLNLYCKPMLEVLCSKEVVRSSVREERLGLGIVCKVVDNVVAVAKVLKIR